MCPKKLPTLINQERWVEVEKRISTNPNEVQLWDDGILPIHRACCYKIVPLQVVETLIHAYPTSLEQKAKACGRIPLHFAVCRNISTDFNIVKMILRHYESGASVKDGHGRTPLSSHLSTSPSLSLKVVKMLVDAYPDAVFRRSGDQWYPLHHSATRGDWEITHYLITLNPDALLEGNNDDMTPKDIADSFDNYELRNNLCKEEARRFGSSTRAKIPFLNETGHEVVYPEYGHNTNASNVHDRQDIHSIKAGKYVDDSIGVLSEERMSSNYWNKSVKVKVEIIQDQHTVHNNYFCYSSTDSLSCNTNKPISENGPAVKNTTSSSFYSPEQKPMFNLKSKLEEVEKFWGVESLSTQNVMKRITSVEKNVFNEAREGGLKGRISDLVYVNGRDSTTWEEWISDIELFFVQEQRRGPTTERIEFLEKLVEGQVKSGCLRDRILFLNKVG